VYLKNSAPPGCSGGPGYLGRPGRRALGVLCVVLAVAGFALTGCGGSTPTQATGGPQSSVMPSGVTSTLEGTSTEADTGPSAPGDMVDARALSKRMTAALAASGGCRFRVSIGTAKLTGSFAFGKTLTFGMISKVRAQGQLTVGDGRSARYVAILGARPDRQIYVNDGTLIGGRHWAQVPDMGMGLKEPEALIKSHLLYLAVARMISPVDPQGASTTINDPFRTVGSEVIEGVNTTHYSWATAGQPAFDLWLDAHDRPMRFVEKQSDRPASTSTYDRWGQQPEITPPAVADTIVLPVIDLG
jgi:hypothetical protein